MKYLYVLLAFSFLFSCKDENKKHAESVLREWMNKEIVFPNKMYFSIQGKENVDFRIKDTEYKIVAYVDSAGCTSCKLHLSKWKELIHYVDSIQSERVQFLFFFFPKNGRDIYHTMRMDKFTYPVCVDTLDSFNKLNHFPDDVRFQTFLLNKENKVVAVGNPIHNPNIRDLFLNIISGGTSLPDEKRPQTEVKIEALSMDLGMFDWKKEQKCIFTVENTGKELLVIDDVNTSCGCITVEYSREPVQSGKTIDITVVYKAEYPEHFNKTITVYCNSPVSPLQLKIKGDAK